LHLACTQASEFPFIKLITPDTFVGKGEHEKVSRIAKVFEDAYKSPFSVVVVDDIERLIDFNEVGARFSNFVLQALLVLFKKLPPPGHKLMVSVSRASL
jgi:vesicle-fusing ATPase